MLSVRTTARSMEKKAVKLGSRQLDRWEKLSLKQKNKILYILLGIGFANLLYSIFTVYTLLSAGIILLAVGLIAKVRWEALLERGLITLLPKKTQKTLLERSIFDVLCDVWFVPRFGTYLKVFVQPFLVSINPEDAIHQLEDLPESSQRMILQKGVVNVLPRRARMLLLPKGYRKSSPDCLISRNESEDRDSETSSRPRRHSLVISHSSNNLLTDGGQPVHVEKYKESEITSFKEKNSILSTDDEPKSAFNQKLNTVKSWLDLTKTAPAAITQATVTETERTVAVVPHKSSKSKKKAFELKALQKIEKSYILDPLDGRSFRSEVISSNKMPMPKALTQPLDAQKWDKLDIFLRKNQEKIRHMANKTTRKAAPLKGPLQMIDKMMGLLHISRQGFLHQVDNKILFKLFSASTLALVVQFSISKKTRYWLYNTFNILLYVAGFILSTGTLTLFLLKVKKTRDEYQKRIESLKPPTDNSSNEHHLHH